MKGIEVLILLFLGGGEEASVSMDKQQRGGGAGKVSLHFPAKQSSFPVLWHEIHYMSLSFPSEAVFGGNQRSKATQQTDHSNPNGICLLQRDK